MKVKTVSSAILGTCLSVGMLSAAEPQAVPVTDPTPVGTYYSLTLKQPPFPFNPFPELPVYSTGTSAFVYDDRSVD